MTGVWLYFDLTSNEDREPVSFTNDAIVTKRNVAIFLSSEGGSSRTIVTAIKDIQDEAHKIHESCLVLSAARPSLLDSEHSQCLCIGDRIIAIDDQKLYSKGIHEVLWTIKAIASRGEMLTRVVFQRPVSCTVVSFRMRNVVVKTNLPDPSSSEANKRLSHTDYSFRMPPSDPKDSNGKHNLGHPFIPDQMIPTDTPVQLSSVSSNRRPERGSDLPITSGLGSGFTSHEEREFRKASSYSSFLGADTAPRLSGSEAVRNPIGIAIDLKNKSASFQESSNRQESSKRQESSYKQETSSTGIHGSYVLKPVMTASNHTAQQGISSPEKQILAATNSTMLSQSWSERGPSSTLLHSSNVPDDNLLGNVSDRFHGMKPFPFHRCRDGTPFWKGRAEKTMSSLQAAEDAARSRIETATDDSRRDSEPLFRNFTIMTPRNLNSDESRRSREIGRSSGQAEIAAAKNNSRESFSSQFWSPAARAAKDRHSTPDDFSEDEMKREGTHSPSKKNEAHVEMDYVMLGSKIVPLSEFQSMDDAMASLVAGGLVQEEEEERRRSGGAIVMREITF